MSDSDPIPVVEETTPPVLSYANLRGQQPSDSRFVCEVLPDGVRLTEEPLPNAGRVDRWFGLVILAMAVPLAIFLMSVVLQESHRQSTDWARALAIPLILITGGAGLFFQGRVRQTQGVSLQVGGGCLAASTPDLFNRHRSWKITEDLKVGVNSTPGFVQQRNRFGLLSTVVVRPSRFAKSPILQNRPKDECEWVVRELKQGIERSVAANKTRGVPIVET